MKERKIGLYCGKTFESYPSQHKKCCSHSCDGKYKATLGIKPPPPKGRVVNEETRKKISELKKELFTEQRL